MDCYRHSVTVLYKIKGARVILEHTIRVILEHTGKCPLRVILEHRGNPIRINLEHTLICGTHVAWGGVGGWVG